VSLSTLQQQQKRKLNSETTRGRGSDKVATKAFLSCCQARMMLFVILSFPLTTTATGCSSVSLQRPDSLFSRFLFFRSPLHYTSDPHTLFSNSCCCCCCCICCFFCLCCSASSSLALFLPLHTLTPTYSYNTQATDMHYFYTPSLPPSPPPSLLPEE